MNKHIKLYEDFVNESRIVEAKVDPAEVEKKIGEYIKKAYEYESKEASKDVEVAKLEYEKKLLRHQGADEKKIEAVEKKRMDVKFAQGDSWAVLGALTKFREEIQAMDLKGKKKAIKEAVWAGRRVADQQAKIDNLKEMAKTYKTLAQKAGKEISDNEKEKYDDWAKGPEEKISKSEESLKETVDEYKAAIDDLQGKGNKEEKKMTASELAEYVWKNWKKITGLKPSAKNEEGDFPEEVQELMKKHNIDYGDFSDAWSDEAEANSSR